VQGHYLSQITKDISEALDNSLRTGILVVSGYGVHIGVEHGQLIVSDGFGRERRHGALSRATCGLKRLVVLGHSGTISLEALRWLHDLHAAIVQLDADGTVILTSAPSGLNDARLRRAQAVAGLAAVGQRIAQDLVRTKLDQQAALLREMGASAGSIEIVLTARGNLDATEDAPSLMVLEATAAAAYWGAWEQLPIHFARKDEPHIPAHWRTFGGRTSPLTASPRKAANPANALLNYLYAMLEAEARIAAVTVGLDPGMGFLHADQVRRDSLACDLMEAVRPEVDRFVYEVLTATTFSRQDFFETRQGVCRVLPPLTHVLAETAARWARVIGPVVEQVARLLATESVIAVGQSRQGASGGIGRPRTHRSSTGTSPTTTTAKRRALPTPLTQANRRAGRKVTSPAGSATAPTKAHRSLVSRCRTCGGMLDADHKDSGYCASCQPEHKAETLAAFMRAGPDALAERRAAGNDPAHSDAADRAKGARNLQHMEAAEAWEREHGKGDAALNREQFTREILPLLQSVPIRQIQRATGLSLRYVSLIRRGEALPHPRHWATLAALSTSSTSHTTTSES
jgi:CRISPR-associated endonuclease Cas1